ncbi:phosphoenolpyruvate carboxylase [Rubinisphaera margarita]|uniref:phosphoenolpyruvate carboxylase n=1 Tax=Rubinisphaera margarita TaxID=2909586 RepID=UPI001EE91D0F|nr:phosphoenolpyruvate carboxylase [Rubinisphaera margarita]MCG6158174.1 phosphoenolpyruvate carboxylase [Rubinisphaera margarita]
MTTLRSDKTLNYLVELLDLVVREQVGESLADTMQTIRRLAIERRAGLPDAEGRLVETLKTLESDELRAVIRWLSLFFDLANAAEERTRIEVLNERDHQSRSQRVPRGESIAAAVSELAEQGLSASEMQRWLDRLKIEPVFTAHPSEAKRRTTRQLLRRIRQLLPEIGADAPVDVEPEIVADLTVLWQSDLIRPERPPVMSEVSRGLYFASTLWDVVPRVYQELRGALRDSYPNHHFEIPRFLSFGSWIGGDRDGHPFVTADITRQTFGRLRRAALEGHLEVCRDLRNQIVMSDQLIPSAPGLRAKLDSCCEQWPALQDAIAAISKSETYRRYLGMLQYRLGMTLESIESDSLAAGAYESVDEFREELRQLRESIAENRGERIAHQYLQPWIDLVQTFGFHFAALDVRQNSVTHRNCLEEVLALQGISEPQGQPATIDAGRLGEEAAEVFRTFMLLAEAYDSWGHEAIGGYIISMTHSAADVLTVLWLWQTAWRQCHGDDKDVPALPIIPLFETIDDLRNSASILDELMTDEQYRQYLTETGQKQQIVMVGYSDSTKDGGYLTACWELHQGQAQLAETAEKHHIQLTIFHGRGGALGRGGGPAARAIRSLPQNAVGGRLRVTDQGEVLSERYDDPVIAHRHLEQVLNATLMVSAGTKETPDPIWSTIMDRLSVASLKKYRELIEHPGFLSYFDHATPISEIETLPIGSRPSRRRGQQRALSDLRAIPWTFAWTQSRHLLPAWYGMGTAIREFVDADESTWSHIRAMYVQWPVFRALIDNAELALTKADMEIAREYASLAPKESGSEVWDMISAEFELSRGAVLMVKDSPELLADIDWLKTSVRSRNPYVDPLNIAQIILLERIRANDVENDELTQLVRLSIQGIASGLRTTG